MEEHTPIVLLMVWGMRHPMEPVTLCHIQPILMVLMVLAEVLAEDLAVAEVSAVAEDLVVAEDLAEEDGGKLYNTVVGAVLKFCQDCSRMVSK